MARSEDLREQFRQLNKKAQRIQRQTEMIRRRFPIARTALETLANGNHAPEVLRTAREALSELNMYSVPPEKQCLFLVTDTLTPPVDVNDLRRYRELLESLAAELDVSTDSDEGPKGSIAVSGLQKVVERVCGPGANAQALWLRNGLLEMFLREGYLAPLRSCTELDGAVLRVTATIPFEGQDLKPDTFVHRLRGEGIEVAGTADRQFASSGDEADCYRRLQHHYRLMNVDTQQLEYENGIASTNLAIVRDALEILSKQDHAPESLRVVQNALDELNTTSESERVLSFMQGVELGAPIPLVDPIDLRHVQELYEQSYAQRRDLGIGGNVAIETSLMASVCSPGADMGAVWIRSALLGLMLRQGVLADWQRGTGLDDAVYRVAAAIPLNGFQLDPSAFIQRLREEVARQSDLGPA
jgi:hypothetical protein